jgi:hypothetical protein
MDVYPNPAQNILQITCHLPQRSMLTLGLYDLLGRLRTELASEMVDAGVLHRQLRVSGLGHGVHFLRLQTQSGTATQSVILY